MSIAKKGSGVSLGQSMFVDWDTLGNAVNKWAKDYFGEHVEGDGNRDEDAFEMSLSGLKGSDYEEFVQLFELYDTEREYEPEYEFETGTSIIPAVITRRLMPEVLKETGLVAYGTALATYNGVFFMERDRYGRLERGLDATIATAQEQSQTSNVSVNGKEEFVKE